MKESEFIIICNNNLIDPAIALENDKVYKFLIDAKNKKYKNNKAMIILNNILISEF